jgi:hypothetical protein
VSSLPVAAILACIGDRGGAASRWELAVYTAAARIHPHRVIPVVLDTGTDNLALLNDDVPGRPARRIRDHRYDELIDAYVTATASSSPGALAIPLFGTVVGWLGTKRRMSRVANCHRPQPAVMSNEKAYDHDR